jgi:hypothetical protein
MLNGRQAISLEDAKRKFGRYASKAIEFTSGNLSFVLES